MSELEELLAEACGEGMRFQLDGAALKCLSPDGTSERHSSALRPWGEKICGALVGSGLDPHPLPAAPFAMLPIAITQVGWFQLDAQGRIPRSYHPCVAWRLKGEVSLEALQGAISELIHRHENLRARFLSVDGIPLQVVESRRSSAIEIIDLSGSKEDCSRANSVDLLCDIAYRPFSLAAGRLFRAALVKFGTEEHVLLICVHHIVCDARSLEILKREIKLLYNAFCVHRRSPLAGLRTSIVNYSLWERRLATGASLERYREYWNRRLAGARPLFLPYDFKHGAGVPGVTARVDVAIAEDVVASVRRTRLASGATLYHLLLSCLFVSLQEWTGNDDLPILSVAPGRMRAHADELFGCFLRFVVIRVDLKGAKTLDDVVRQVREVSLGAAMHQAWTNYLGAKELGLHRLLFNYIPSEVEGDGPAAAMECWPTAEEIDLPYIHEQADFDLRIAVREGRDGVTGHCYYDTKRFSGSTIAKFVDRFLSVVAAAAASTVQLRGTPVSV